MSDHDHIDAQWLRAAQSPPPPPRRRGHGCGLSLLVLILVLAGVLFYPRVQALADRSPALRIERTAFGDGVTVFASAREEALPAVQTALRDALGGRISFADGGRGYAEV